MSDLFMLATQRAYRFSSLRGELTTEQLWQLPLSHKSGFDLDTVAKTAAAELRALTTESFVTPTVSSGTTDATNKLEIIKAIIASKLEAQAAATKRAQRADERRRVLEALANKEQAELSSASREELLRRLADLDG